MSTPQYTVDVTPTDIFSAGQWRKPAACAPIALERVCTKLVADFQSVHRGQVDECVRRNLELLREATGWDCVYLLTLGQAEARVLKVQTARSVLAQTRVEALRGERLHALPWIAGRLQHLALSELGNTRMPREEQRIDAQRLAALGVGSTVMISLHVAGEPAHLLGLAHTEPRVAWDPSLQLLLKLAAISFAAGLERIRLEQRLVKLEERDALAQAAASDGLWDFDVESNDVYFSPRWKAMLGYDSQELAGPLDLLSFVHPEDLSRVQAAMREHIAGKTRLFESQHRLRHRDGRWRWVASRASARVDTQRRVLRLVGIDVDITERKLYEETLFREKESAHITLRSIGDGVITTDASSVIDYINPVAEELMGWPLEDAKGRPVADIFHALHEETCEPLENPLTAAIRQGRAVKSLQPALLVRRDGHELYIDSTAAPIRDANGEIAGGVLVFHDVTESRRLNRRLSHQASHDPLTGLVNRPEFERRLAWALEGAKEGEGPHAVLYLDIDQFKIVNDTCGPRAGDALLKALARLLMSSVTPDRDTVSRLGGDEFGILLERCVMQEAVRIAECLRESVRDFRFSWEDRPVRLRASIGVVPVSADNEDVAQILSAAHGACAAAQESGRNRVHSFAENDIDLIRRRTEMEWVTRINAALDEGRFELFSMGIQPLQQAEKGTHYEVLLRLRDESDRIVSPKDFIMAAERYCLTPAIDRWVIENAFRWLGTQADERLALCAVNVSGQSLGDDRFLPFVIEQLEGRKLDGSKICFEITETAAVANVGQANRFIHALREHGCKFALDDFGAGMSSYGYLKDFSVDFLKIDGRFVREIVSNDMDRAMVRSINEIGHQAGTRTIAEFAENAEIIHMLTLLGVDYAQGYGIARPERLARDAAA